MGFDLVLLFFGHTYMYISCFPLYLMDLGLDCSQWYYCIVPIFCHQEILHCCEIIWIFQQVLLSMIWFLYSCSALRIGRNAHRRHICKTTNHLSNKTCLWSKQLSTSYPREFILYFNVSTLILISTGNLIFYRKLQFLYSGFDPL